jgi:hypothetical protein
MMVLRRLVGMGEPRAARPTAPPDDQETATVRRIVAELDALPAE